MYLAWTGISVEYTVRRTPDRHFVSTLRGAMGGVPVSTVEDVERHFHALIRERAGDLLTQQNVELRSLSGPRPNKRKPAWFPIPGMYGGFNYWWVGRGRSAKLVAESWCRVVAGSGQRHEITSEGASLIEEGFV